MSSVRRVVIHVPVLTDPPAQLLIWWFAEGTEMQPEIQESSLVLKLLGSPPCDNIPFYLSC